MAFTNLRLVGLVILRLALAGRAACRAAHDWPVEHSLLQVAVAAGRWTGQVGQIHDGRGRCLEAKEPAANGGGLQLAVCSPGSQAQQWAYDESTGHIQNLYGICLDSPQRHINGGMVHMWECMPQEANQQWTYAEATGQIKSRDGACLDADGGVGPHMWACLLGEPNQQWDLGASSPGAASGSDPSCHVAQVGETCYTAVKWAMRAGIVGHPEWYPGLNPSSTFVEFQALMHQNGDHSCPKPCSATPTTAAPTTATPPSLCSRLPNVALPCSQDRCKVVAKRMRGVTCSDYCKSSGLACVGMWANVLRTCSVKHSLGCDEPSQRYTAVCECSATLTTTFSLTTTTTLAPETTSQLSVPTCESVLDTPVGRVWDKKWYTCRQRITWLQRPRPEGGGLTEMEARIQVSLNFALCEPCWPWEKYKSPGDHRRSAKRGIAIQDHLLNAEALASVATIASWGYIWDFSPDYSWPEGGPTMAEWNVAGIRFIPMTWGSKQLEPARQRGLPGGRQALLGFNEPNFEDQAHLSPTAAASLWPQVEELAAKYGIDYVVSPAVNFHEVNDPIAWLTDFLKECSGCKVDAIAFHSYTCHGQYLRNHLDMYRVFGKPLWLTEFACSEPGRLSAEGQMAYMREAVPLLEHDPDVEMYAWFSYFQDEWEFPTGDDNGDAGLVYRNGSLTLLGQLYGSFASTVPVDPPQTGTPPTTSLPTTEIATTTPSGPSAPPPDTCHTAVAGDKCYEEVMWAMSEGIQQNPAWYPGLTTASGFRDFQRLLFKRRHMDGVCLSPCDTCRSAVSGDRCFAAVTRAMSRIQAHPEAYPGLGPSSSFNEFQALLHGSGAAGGACEQPCASPGNPDVERCYADPGGCSSVGVNVFGADGFESPAALRLAVDSLFARGVRHFRVVNVGAWADAVLEAIDAASVAFGVSDRVSLQITSLFFESPATCPSLPAWQDHSLSATVMRLSKLKNIGRILVQLDTCSVCVDSALHCTNPTEQAFGQDLRFGGSTGTANAIGDFIRNDGSDGYGPAHIVAAHRALPSNVEFVLPYMNEVQSPTAMVEHLVKTYILPLRAQGRKFHLEGTFYPFWVSSEKAFAPFPAEQVYRFVTRAVALGFDGFVVAETGWPEACPDTDLTKTRIADLQSKCRYLGSVLMEAERLAQASRANGDGELLTYLWKFGPADDGSGCGEQGFGLFRKDGSFACTGSVPQWS